jgi:hypothetical protein
LEPKPTVRAKFQVQQKTQHVYQHAAGGGIVALSAVYEDGGVNKSWAKSTPSGTITMQIDNPEAFAALELGAYFFVDFTPTTRE